VSNHDVFMKLRPSPRTLPKSAQTPASPWSAVVMSCIMLFLPLCVQAQSAGEPPEWQSFERRVRDGKIGAGEAVTALKGWSRQLRSLFPPERFGKEVSFPLAGHGIQNIGGSGGEGYRPEGYRFLDGNAHRGHPAQDIFILDADRDGLEDRSRTHEKVLALADGVVLSTFDGWANARELRGGNYVWIYHPALEIFSYCAHLHHVMVEPGDRVRGGEQIATLGRSGKHASLPRSPTHLHIMLLEVDGMRPIDPYPLLQQAAAGGR
jgi:murein DD-endopeptidase MepM/ murein hydrolase activator NlpD